MDDLGGSRLENSNAYAISVWASWSFNQYGGEEEEKVYSDIYGHPRVIEESLGLGGRGFLIRKQHCPHFSFYIMARWCW